MIDMNNATTDSFYKQVFENSNDIQVIVDGENGQIVNANKRACEFYGYSKEKIKSFKIYNISKAKNLEEIGHVFNQPLNYKSSEIYLTHKLENGSEEDTKVTFSKICINGKIYFNMAIKDIF